MWVEYDKDTPRRTARTAASEKFNTQVTEITVEARHKLAALRMPAIGADCSGDEGRTVSASKGGMAANPNNVKEIVYKTGCQRT